MTIAKAITYENLPEENKKDPKILPFEYKKPFLQEIDEILKEKENQARKGIMSTLVAQMSELETKKYLGGFLVPFGFTEEAILRMSIPEIEGHLRNLMNR
jgi:hypothetical protein